MAHAIPWAKRRQLRDLVTHATDTSHANQLLEVLIDGITTLLDGEVGGFNDVDLIGGRATVVMRPQVLTDPTDPVRRTLAIHPATAFYQRDGVQPKPALLSRCPMGRWRRWADHPAYSILFKPMRTPHELLIPLPWNRPLRHGSVYAVTRGGSDFNDHHLDIAAAIRAALWVLHDADPAVAAAGRLHLLTTTERYVLELYGLGLTANQIAQNRRVSPHTITTQLATAAAKLRITGRNHDRKSAISRTLGYQPALPTPTDRLAAILDS